MSSFYHHILCWIISILNNVKEETTAGDWVLIVVAGDNVTAGDLTNATITSNGGTYIVAAVTLSNCSKEKRNNRK